MVGYGAGPGPQRAADADRDARVPLAGRPARLGRHPAAARGVRGGAVAVARRAAGDPADRRRGAARHADRARAVGAGRAGGAAGGPRLAAAAGRGGGHRHRGHAAPHRRRPRRRPAAGRGRAVGRAVRLRRRGRGGLPPRPGRAARPCSGRARRPPVPAGADGPRHAGLGAAAPRAPDPSAPDTDARTSTLVSVLAGPAHPGACSAAGCRSWTRPRSAVRGRRRARHGRARCCWWARSAGSWPSSRAR